MKFSLSPLPGVVLMEPAVHADDRGWFSESHNQRRFVDGLTALGEPADFDFVQDNESSSRRGVLRGLHYQLAPHAQGKLVRVSQGAVFDVAIDLRRSSPHFGRWFGAELSALNRHQIWIPPGFGHGFIALQDDTRFHYKTTAYYARDHERAVAWNDPQINIVWPPHVQPMLASKDAAAPLLCDAEVFT